MHFVQLLSSIFFLIREPLAIWMLMLLGSLYPIYIKREKQDFLPLWMGMFKLPSHRRKRSEMRTFSSGSTFWAAIASVHENMSSMPSQSPWLWVLYFTMSLGALWCRNPTSLTSLWICFWYLFFASSFLLSFISQWHLKKSGTFLYSFSFRILEDFLRHAGNAFGSGISCSLKVVKYQLVDIKKFLSYTLSWLY